MRKTVSLKTIILAAGLLPQACFNLAEDDKTKAKSEAELAGDESSSASEASCGENPYLGKSLPVNPFYANRVTENSIPLVKGTELEDPMEKLASMSTAVWIDKTDSIAKIDPAIENAKLTTSQTGKKSQLTIVVYNLPVRDCAANASNGELLSDQMDHYKHNFIDVIAGKLEQAKEQSFSIIMEVDSLPNLVSNMGIETCQTAAPLYKEGIAYAIKKFQLPNVSIYLDTAHAGWLGWKGNQKKMAQIFKDVLDMAGGVDTIRGFASNVSNYTPLERIGADRSEPYYSWNDALGELDFVSQLKDELAQVGITGKGFLIDTSRNGVNKPREDWGHWCNVKGAGLGQDQAIAPNTNGKASCVDAYLWVKPPGESDGTTDQSSPRYDSMCGHGKIDAPEAGEWFHEHLVDMIKNTTSFMN